MRGFFPENVSNYTREQCEEYLAAHPNGLRSDSVRERLRVLSQEKVTTPQDYEDDVFWHSHNSTIPKLRDYQTHYPKGRHIDECVKKESALNHRIASIVYSLYPHYSVQGIIRRQTERKKTNLEENKPRKINDYQYSSASCSYSKESASQTNHHVVSANNGLDRDVLKKIVKVLFSIALVGGAVALIIICANANPHSRTWRTVAAGLWFVVVAPILKWLWG